MPRHFESRVESTGREFFEQALEAARTGIEDGIDAHLASELSPIRAYFGANNFRCTQSLTHRSGEEADRAHACYEDRLILNRTGERGMDSIAESVLEGSNLLRYGAIGGPRVVLGDHDVVREPAVDIDAKDDRVHADVALAIEALLAMAANDVRFAGNKIADFAIFNTLSDLDDGAAELMADNSRGLYPGRRPGIP